MNLLLWLPPLMTHNLAQSQPIFTATVKNRWRRHTGARDKAQDPAISPRLCVTKSFLSPMFSAAPLEFSRLSAPLSSACDKSFLAELERTRVGKRFSWQTAHRPRSEQTKISSTGTNKKQQPRNTKRKDRERSAFFQLSLRLSLNHASSTWKLWMLSRFCCFSACAFVNFFNLLRCE